MKRQIYCIRFEVFFLPVIGAKSPSHICSSSCLYVFWLFLFFWLSSAFSLTLQLSFGSSVFQPLTWSFLFVHLCVYVSLTHCLSHTSWSKMDSQNQPQHTHHFFRTYENTHRHSFTHWSLTHTHTHTHTLAGVKEDQRVVMLPLCLCVVVVTTSWGNKRWRISLLSAIFISLPPSSISLYLFPSLCPSLFHTASRLLTKRPTLLSSFFFFFVISAFLLLCLVYFLV